MNETKHAMDIFELGKEYPRPGEEEVARYIVKLLQDQMLRMYEPGKKKQLRQIHPKMNGCVKAEFIIKPDIPEVYRAGVFRQPGSFPAWVRFSNGETAPKPDYKKDIRGFAIKLMNVPGDKMYGGGNQDFILMNTKNFPSRDVRKFADVLYAVTSTKQFKNLFKVLGILFSNIPIIVRGKLKAPIHMKHPSEVPYFSTVPYRLGDESKAVKYGVFPVGELSPEFKSAKGENQIRENLVASLKSRELLFDFCIQIQTDPVKMPVEDPTVIWESEFIKLATIRIPPQVFDTAEQNEFGDNLSFNVWHTLPEHRPIGNFNRVRGIIYEEMSKFRHQCNNIPVTEPTAGPDFLKP